MGTLLLSGVSMGAFCIALALGVVLTERYTRTLNFAHAAVGTLSGYCALVLLEHHVNYAVAAMLAILVGSGASTALGVLVSHWFKDASPLVRTMATLGPSIALTGLVGVVWGESSYSLAPPALFSRPVSVFGSTITGSGLAAVAGLVVFIAGFGSVLRWTRYGLALRCMSNGVVISESYGINVGRLEQSVWAIAGATGAWAGLLISGSNELTPNFLTSFLIIAFVAVVLGGALNTAGLMVGGLLFGMVVAASEYYFQDDVSMAVALAVLLAVLSVRPRGIFAGRHEDYAADSQVPTRQRSIVTRTAAWRLVRARSAPVLAEIRRRVAGLSGGRARWSAWFVLAVVVTAVVPAIGPPAMLFAVASAFAMLVAVSGQNLVSGLTGQLSLAQGGIMLVSGYAAALLVNRAGLDVLAAIGVACAIAAVLGCVLSLLTLRATGLQLAIVTMAFTLAAGEIATNWHSITNGSVGLPTEVLSIGGLSLFTPRNMYFGSLALAAVAMTPIMALSRSSYGKRWRAVRDSPQGAVASGIAVRWPKFGAAVAGSAAGGFAGSLMTFQTGIISPTAFTVYTSIYILLAAAIAGADGVLLGPLVGALFIELLPYLLSQSGSAAQIVFGVAVVVLLGARVRLAGVRSGRARADRDVVIGGESSRSSAGEAGSSDRSWSASAEV